jgi:hypothetical protein
MSIARTPNYSSSSGRSGIFVENAAPGESPSPPLEERVGERSPFLAIVLGHWKRHIT